MGETLAAFHPSPPPTYHLASQPGERAPNRLLPDLWGPSSQEGSFLDSSPKGSGRNQATLAPGPDTPTLPPSPNQCPPHVPSAHRAQRLRIPLLRLSSLREALPWSLRFLGPIGAAITRCGFPATHSSAGTLGSAISLGNSPVGPRKVDVVFNPLVLTYLC